MCNDLKNDLSIIVSCSDDTLDVFENFLLLFKKYWCDCPFSLYLVTPTKRYDDAIVNSIVTDENTKWAERIIKSLKIVKTKYILTLCEDAFISKKIDNLYVESVVRFIKDNNVKYYCCPKFSIKKNKKNRVESFEGAVKISKKKPYGITSFANIWDRDEFIMLFGGKNWSGWDIENYFLELIDKNAKGFYEDYYSDKDDFLNVIESVNHGCWTRETKYFIKNNIHINFGTRRFAPKKDVFKKKMHLLFNKIIPYKLRKPLKRILSKLGYKFVTKG